MENNDIKFEIQVMAEKFQQNWSGNKMDYKKYPKISRKKKGVSYSSRTKSKLLSWNLNEDKSCSQSTYSQDWLFVTNDGEYFLCGHGNPMSLYGQREENSWVWGEDIVPVDEYVAFELMYDSLKREGIDIESHIATLYRIYGEEYYCYKNSNK